MSKPKRIIHVRVLPGEPTDGSGKVCIHLFVQDPVGVIIEPHALHPALDDESKPIKRKLVARPTRGRLACDSKRAVAPVTRNGVTTITPRTDDPRAVTCLKCKMSADYQRMMEVLEKGRK